jgi:hypothetical protein
MMDPGTSAAGGLRFKALTGQFLHFAQVRTNIVDHTHACKTSLV